MTIVVCHPSPSVAEGMAASLTHELDVSVRTATTLAACHRVVAEQRPEIVVLALDLPVGEEVTLCNRLVSQGVRPVVVLPLDSTAHLTLLEHGVAGLAVAADGLAGVLSAVRTVHAGHVHVPAHLLGTVLHELIVERRRRGPHSEDRLESLSPREREVLGLLGHGSDTREIAARLVISPHTAKTHINRVLGKLGVASRTEAARFALDHAVSPTVLEVTGD